MEVVSQKGTNPTVLGRGQLGNLPFSGAVLRAFLVEKLGGPPGSYGGTPNAGSDRDGITAIRSAVADFPLDHILRVRGARVETWWGQGGR